VPRQVRDSISIVVFNIGNCMHFTSNQIPEWHARGLHVVRNTPHDIIISIVCRRWCVRSLFAKTLWCQGDMFIPCTSCNCKVTIVYNRNITHSKQICIH
jgi:hypothetical protein